MNTGLGDLPAEWDLVRFGECAEIIAGQSPKGDTYNSERIGKPLLNGPAEFGATTPKIVQWTSKPTKLAVAGDVLFCVRGNTTGRMNISDQEYCIGRGLAAIRQVDGKSTTPFVYFLLCLLRPIIYAIATAGGSTFPNISKSTLSDFEVPLPPLSEQKKIAHILSTVQRAIEVQERIIQINTELKKALMQKLFTQGVRNEPQKQTEIGPIPESWDLLPISDLFETQLGKMLSQKAKVGDSPKPYLRNKNIQWGRIDTDDLLRMDFNDREAQKFLLQKGDLLVCEGGEVGRAALWDGSITECYYQKALHRLRPKTDRITNNFMAHWMMFAFLLTNTYGVTGTRTTIAHLPEIKLKPLLVPIPAPEVRDEITYALDSSEQKIENHRRKQARLRELFRTLLHELMTAKTRVRNQEFLGPHSTN